ncbi:Smr/MutS family protein [Rhodoblastus sp. 17X3]|uniref:Smr/MutS family protein n=1 Tax=Rhodoblastus sp. 17X3 TaxID=3047026 RepID=UPI0024B7269C|nr:Smr/MutS family protein [Rhodoblastus sp. 17X3]MDI9848315.1 Smr/MutS family protein [Rhodoblastus sp. 17X3]
MKGGGEFKRAPRIRRLSREELALWRHATADVKTARERTRPDPESAPPAPEPPVAPLVASPVRTPPRIVEEKPKTPALAPLAPLERRMKRRLSAGKAQVDDVIDLHGLTQAQAHRALNNFLWRSAENGAKLVLVITGKGAPAGEEERYDSERGVLRRNAPHWLRTPELRAIVLSIEEAARPHGGSGALYVRLRRRSPG